MAPPLKKRSYESDDSVSSEDEIQEVLPNPDHWSRFLVMSAPNDGPLKLNPFAISKGIEGLAGDVKEIKKLRSGSLLIECKKKSQSQILLSTKSLANVPVEVSPHRTLNSCKGIVRDVGRCLSDMDESDIISELRSQGVTAVKRFTYKRENDIIKTNTYLFTFGLPTRPESLKAGYCHLRVNTYIPNPLRCYRCQKYGHGTKSCRSPAACHRCGGTCEDGKLCDKPPACVNCSGNHPSSSRTCPTWELQSKISKIKHERNVSFLEARKLVLALEKPGQSYAAAASVSIPTSRSVSYQSVCCQTDYTWMESSAPILITSPRQSSSSSSQTDDPSTVVSHSPMTSTVNLQSVPKPSSDLKTTTKKSDHSNRSDRIPKGQRDPVRIQNRFQTLEDMDVSPLPHRRTTSKSPRKGKHRSPVQPPLT
ncbi:uncharacterized protein [Haliotis asinina]|uniref:uncharacterized protein n=1 Tax=Haliotis asinina TaxID=109174 RepID=UPI003531D8A2